MLISDRAYVKGRPMMRHVKTLQRVLDFLENARAAEAPRRRSARRLLFRQGAEVMRSRNAATLVLVLLLTAVNIATAQERFGAITGKVTDQTELATPGVVVTLTNKETQRVTSVVVGADGTYTARGLDPGRYSVKFELQGF